MSDETLEARVARALAESDTATLRTLVVELALHHPDARTATATCVALAAHPDAWVRGNAVLGLGHIARRFRALDDAAKAIVESALTDVERVVRGQARSAADDLRQFLGWRFSVGVHVDRVLWIGRALDRRWRARHVDWIPPGDDAPGTWPLILETTDEGPRESLRTWWSSEERILEAAPEGWPRSAIASLQRTLAESPSPTLVPR